MRTSEIINQAFLGSAEGGSLAGQDQCVRIDLTEPGPKSQYPGRGPPSHPWHPPAVTPAAYGIGSRGRACQAALTELRNLPTSSLRRLPLPAHISAAG